MFVIEVIPFLKTAQLESLSYYSSTDYPTGTIITVPVRKKTTSAMVLSSEPVSNAKTALRAATFSLKKLAPQQNTSTLPDSLLATAKKLSATYPASLGNLIFSLLPPDIKNGLRPYPDTPSGVPGEHEVPQVLQAVREERFIAYRSYIRQAFAHRGSVLLVVPHSAAVAEAARTLATGIEKRLVTFSSTHTKKQLDTSYHAFSDLRTAKLIITTPQYAFLERHDITSIIIEEAGSSYYKSKTRPYVDARDALRDYAAITSRHLFLGDILLRTEEEQQRRADLFTDYEEEVQRLNFNNTFQVSTPKKPTRSEPLSCLTKPLEKVIAATLDAKGRVFLLAARRGFAPLIVCNDCGHILRCEKSGAPFSLYTERKKDGTDVRWLFCATSGTKMLAFDTCPHCTSWRLREQGIGIQRVAAEVREKFPDTPLIIFDHTNAKTPQQAKRLQEAFYKEKKVIMIGTQMALPYLTKKVHVSSVISFEAMRALPTWQAEEQLLRQLLTLRDSTLNLLLVQTKDPEDPLLQHTKRGSIGDFYSEEIAMRQMLSYPPFSALIHLTWQGTKEQRDATEKLIEETLHYRDMQCYHNQQPGAEPLRHALMKVSQADWPDEELITELRALPPSVRIEIGPERII